MNGIHRAFLTLSGGRLGWDLGSMPVLELTTTGRKSGAKRSCMLTSPIRVGGSYVVVASRGGEDEHPSWFLNLRDEPRVEVIIKGGPSEPRIARIASPEERAELWPKITSRYRNYAGYQKRTSREIPLVFLDPIT